MRLQFYQRAGSHMAAHAGCAGGLELPWVCPKHRQVLNVLSVYPLMTLCLIQIIIVITSASTDISDAEHADAKQAHCLPCSTGCSGSLLLEGVQMPHRGPPMRAIPWTVEVGQVHKH